MYLSKLIKAFKFIVWAWPLCFLGSISCPCTVGMIGEVKLGMFICNRNIVAL